MNNITDAHWDNFVTAHNTPHILQTSGWAIFKSEFGWRHSRVVETGEDHQIRAGASILYRRVNGLTMAYVPRGPLTDWHDYKLTTTLLDTIALEAQQQGASILKIEPELPDTLANRALLQRYGLQPSPQTIQPPSTIIIDIADDEEAIFKRMKKKWRYNIRLAERREVTIRAAAHDDLGSFNEMMETTGQRNTFYVHSTEYYSDAFQRFVPEQATFLLAEHEGLTLASIVVFVTGKMAWYLWGASSNRERNRMPNYALQWAAIQWAKAQGATHYDLWGIPDEVGKVAVGMQRGQGKPIEADQLPLSLHDASLGELWGVCRFKQGFGGHVIRSVGAWDKALQPLGYQIYQTGLKLQSERQRWQSGQIAILPFSSKIDTMPLHTIRHAENWRHILSTLPAPHVLQSWEWGETKRQTGWQAERIALPTQNGNGYDAAFQFLWRQPIAKLPLRVAYIPKGPSLNWEDSQLAERVLTQVEVYARAKGCIFVKIDPDVREDTTAGAALLDLFRSRGWHYSDDQIQYKNTGFTDLTQDEEVLLAGLKSKWRYNVRLATRREIQIRAGTVDDLATFYPIYKETGQRNGFLVRPYDYYERVWTTYLKAQQDGSNPAGGALLLAEHADEALPMAGIFLMHYGDRCWYFYGASSERRRRDMPNYLLQWEGVKWAKEQGCTVYDWWGAPTDVDDPDDDLQGVWQFKQGFGATLQTHVGAWDFPVSPLLYRGYTELMPRLIEFLRR